MLPRTGLSNHVRVRATRLSAPMTPSYLYLPLVNEITVVFAAPLPGLAMALLAMAPLRNPCGVSHTCARRSPTASGAGVIALFARFHAAPATANWVWRTSPAGVERVISSSREGDA